MITLLPINRIIAGIAVGYGAIIAATIGLVAQYSSARDIYSNVKIALAGSTARL